MVLVLLSTGPRALAAPATADDPVVPSAGEVASAKARASAVSTQVAELTTQQQAAQAELTALQLELSRKVAAERAAQEELDLATAVADKAAEQLDAARSRRDEARAAVGSEAAFLWTQSGGTLQNLDLMLSASPESVSDLQVVMDGNSERAGRALETAASAASSATAQEDYLAAAERDQAAAAKRARAARTTAQQAVDSAGARAATLSRRLSDVSARLESLRADAAALSTARSDGLAAQARAREEAARKAEAAAQAARDQAARDRAAAPPAAPTRAGGSSSGGSTSKGSSSSSAGSSSSGSSGSSGGSSGGGSSSGSGSSGGYTGGGSPAEAQATARSMMGSYGWNTGGHFTCLVNLWNGESGWRWSATNPWSGAYGIPQSLPAYKMATAGSDWLTNPTTQIRWGMGYIKGRYGDPCRAWNTWLSRSPHWY